MPIATDSTIWTNARFSSIISNNIPSMNTPKGPCLDARENGSTGGLEPIWLGTEQGYEWELVAVVNLSGPKNGYVVGFL